MCTKLASFFEKQNNLFPGQYGFRKHTSFRKHSTSLALAEFSVKTLQGIERGEPVLAVLTDLSKAFDTLSHVIILDKLWNQRHCLEMGRKLLV